MKMMGSLSCIWHDAVSDRGRLEERGWIKGTWIEKPGERRRRYYKVTAEGRRVLAGQRKTWAAFVEAVRHITGDEHA
jgi:DNA-binding PadR family transcriptional regulator